MGLLDLLSISDLTGGADAYMPTLGQNYTPVSTGASSNVIDFGKVKDSLLKIGLIAGAVLLGLLILKKKK